MPPSPRYQALRPETRAQRRLDNGGDPTTPDDDVERSLARRERWVEWLLYGNCALFLISACFMLWPRHASLSKHTCTKLLSPASPLLDSLEFVEEDFINYFNHSTIYRGPPTKELEIAWLKLWDQPLIGVDDAIVASLNKTNDGRHYEAIGSDPSKPTYAASIEAFHQMHCLCLIRQATWPLSYFNESWNDRAYPYDLVDEVTRRLTIDHCIETIRLGLMCYGDVTPVLVNHRTGHRINRTLDFNVHHKCRDYDKILEAVQRNQVHVDDAQDGLD